MAAAAVHAPVPREAGQPALAVVSHWRGVRPVSRYGSGLQFTPRCRVTRVAGVGGDTMSGALGNDKLYGATGKDHLNGGPGTDLLSAGAGNDSFIASFGRDRVLGGSGVDFINIATAGRRNHYVGDPRPAHGLRRGAPAARHRVAR